MANISQYIQRQSCNTDKLMFDSKQAQVWQIVEHEKPDYIGSYEVVRLVDVLEGEEGEGVFSSMEYALQKAGRIVDQHQAVKQ